MQQAHMATHIAALHLKIRYDLVEAAVLQVMLEGLRIEGVTTELLVGGIEYAL